MLSIRPCAIPESALLLKYLRGGSYADCYVTEVENSVSVAEYVEAFYTTAVFKIERRLLQWLASRPSTDREAGLLAAGALDSFAAWKVEDRAPGQLLLADFTGRTRSWLMACSGGNGDASAGSRLYFGSAVVPVVDPGTGKAGPGLLFRSLLGFHRLYSRVLLLAARSRLRSLPPPRS